MKDLRLPGSLQVLMRHSREDDFVSIACSDQLYKALRGSFPSLQYYRDRSGTHYDEAGRIFLDMLLYLFR